MSEMQTSASRADNSATVLSNKPLQIGQLFIESSVKRRYTGSLPEPLSREERRRRRRASFRYRAAHASRERHRVEAFNTAFAQLRALLPTLPPDKKLSKIEILKLAICYIAYLHHVIEA